MWWWGDTSLQSNCLIYGALYFSLCIKQNRPQAGPVIRPIFAFNNIVLFSLCYFKCYHLILLIFHLQFFINYILSNWVSYRFGNNLISVFTKGSLPPHSSSESLSTRLCGYVTNQVHEGSSVKGSRLQTNALEVIFPINSFRAEPMLLERI